QGCCQPRTEYPPEEMENVPAHRVFFPRNIRRTGAPPCRTGRPGWHGSDPPPYTAPRRLPAWQRPEKPAAAKTRFSPADEVIDVPFSLAFPPVVMIRIARQAMLNHCLPGVFWPLRYFA